MFDLPSLVKAAGLLGIFAIVFAESGLFIGFFLPGDSLLFTAGFLASQGFLDIRWLLILSFAGAVLGDSFGYAFGRRVGYRIFTKEDSLLFHKDHLRKAKVFYEKYGGKAIFLARFLPIVRTFAPILAGVGNMNYRKFLLFNIMGGLAWAVGITLTGFYLGNLIPDIDRYLIPIVLLIIFVSVLPTAIHILKDPDSRKKIFKLLKLSK